MKLFIAGLSTETNSFSPLPTGMASFEEGSIHHGDATRDAPLYWTAPLHLWREQAEALGWEVVESLSAHAQPSGLTVKSVYEGFRDEIIADLKATGGADIILFALHGAMIADGYDDCEGDLIAHARAVCPDAVIGGLLDPHSNLTDTMMTQATLLVAYKEYPHIDVPERAADLFRLAAETAEGKITPVMRDWDCRMIFAMPTPAQPMRGFVDDMIAREGQDGVLSLSLIHGFPWSDHPRTGVRAVAISDGDAARAEAEAEALGQKIFNLRHDLWQVMPDIDAALDMAQAAPEGPVVLADMSDNAGGGAPADATFLLRAMMARGMAGTATGIFWDPVAVRICKEAGEGATLQLRLGGKCGPVSGDPLDLRVTVRKLASGLTQRFGKLDAPLGNTVWLECNGFDIVLSDLRTQTFHPEAFEKMGIDLSKRRYVCVKSSNHYRAGFAPMAALVIGVATPGSITPDFPNIPYVHRDKTYFPRVEDPFA